MSETWRWGFRQFSFDRIPRVPQHLLTPLRLGATAAFPSTFRIQVSHRVQEPPSEFFPGAPWVQQGASWHTSSAAVCARRPAKRP